MNEIHSVEIRLRGWQPRRASAGHKRRLFGTPIHLMSMVAWVVGRLAPVTACALLALSVFISGNDFSGRSSRHDLTATTTPGPQSFRTHAPTGLQRSFSTLHSSAFDLTNHNVSTSNIAASACSRRN